jgi:anti-sigma factor RsiW
MTESSGAILHGDCGRALLLQAELDGELDAAQAAALAEHRAACADCRRNEALLLAARQAVQGATYHRAAPELLRAVASRMGADRLVPPRRRMWSPWAGVAGFGAGAALAAAIVLTLLPAGRPGLVAALVDDHVRALQPGHLLDVVSTNQHTVKPWFDGRLDFAPPVRDLAAAGFPLVGGRLDYLQGRSVAVLIYSHGKHIIELFVWPASAAAAEPAHSTRDGYNIVRWTADGMSLSAVSDLDPAGLAQFVRDWRQTP